MSENNRSYRIRTDITKDKNINIQINNDYDILEILSLKIKTENIYKLHTSSYGCVVGRVLANGGVGVPNAKISIFISVDEETSEDDILYNIYPYSSTLSKNSDGIRYNLLPDEQVSMCHQTVGTMPNKRLVLDDKNTLEIFDKYYKYTTVTNNAGDYMIFGVPVGNQSIHMDVDLSDIGFLSQKPIDMLYKGYNITQFENAQQFKKDSNLNVLSQIISQNTSVYVNPFWGDESESEISITRHDIDVDYKFEPTCIFMGSIVTDSSSNGFSKRCVPTPNMGRMDRLVTGSGTIEMIRKKTDNSVEEFAVKGTEVINGNGVWCYQIPMNLDFITTDEYGNIVPTDNPEKGIPTRTRCRFRVSLNDFDSDYSNNHLVKILVPNNPQKKDELDYVFGSETKDNEEGSLSFRDLFWNNVYTVKSYIPRIQKGNYQRTKKFSGIKNVNVYGNNNPIPYNNMRVNITFMFMLQCAIIKALMFIAKIYNKMLFNLRSSIDGKKAKQAKCMALGDGLCPDLEGWYFAPGCKDGNATNDKFLEHTLNDIKGGNQIDNKSIDVTNKEEDEKYCLDSSEKPNYFMQCIEINLAMENEVIQFDFYNDWMNGLLYIPRWFVKLRKKSSFLFGLIKIKPKMKACLEDSFKQTRNFTQQCALEYTKNDEQSNIFSKNVSRNGCHKKNKQKCHKSNGRKFTKIFGRNGGIVHDEQNWRGLHVFYVKPCEWNNNKKCNLFATDIVLLGSISNENLWGIPNEFDGMVSSTFQMPPNLVQTNMDTDGVMYGVSGTGKYKCTENSKNKKIELVSNTFSSFENWVSDPLEKPNDDVDEYAVTEMSGIDWGFSGPNQGVKDNEKLYQPGGHFLGISCANAEVNIKSCVNLSRICELGTLMSQRQSYLKGEYDNDKKLVSYEYEYIIPSGLISKTEISDTNYRTIFATLNHNKLKTVSDENGMRKYEFISVQPINFNGELSEIINNNEKYNSSINDNNDKNSNGGASAYFRTIEDNSSEYYYFRMGVKYGDSDKVVKEKYLINNGNKVSLPVYENSYYFYYGLKNGSTAMDDFLVNYYSSCPTFLSKIEPKLEIKVTDEINLCCDTGNTLTFNVYDLEPPFRYVLYKDETMFDELSFCLNTENNISGLTSGSYVLNIKKDSDNITLTKSFVINEVLPSSPDSNFNIDSVKIESNDYIFTPKVNIVEGTETENEEKISKAYVTYYNESDKENTLVINKLEEYVEGKSSPYIYGIVVSDGKYYVYENLHDKKRININIEELYKGLNKIDLYYDRITKIENIIDKEGGFIYTWGVNKYTIDIIYGCNKLIKGNEIIPKKYNVGTYFIDSINNNYSYYIYEEELPIQNVEKCLTVDETLIKIDGTKINSIDDPINEWKVKKSIIYNTPLINGEGGEIKFNTKGATPPYTTTIIGNIETTIESGKIELSSDQKVVPSINDILIPTEPWMLDSKDEFKEYAVMEKGGDIKKEEYSYETIDEHGFYPLIIK